MSSIFFIDRRALSRRRKEPGRSSQTPVPCPHCHGTGRVLLMLRTFCNDAPDCQECDGRGYVLEPDRPIFFDI